ncbi:hypothetical protein [Alteromonas sp. 009811495]|uniref:hypothetical protein n=1 Tax=Alteromonas sp. 009811495 TaxID=3002962 RepID=UPI00237E99C7|nr:hypothetical protein [Alteromonas sp. 009811495]WDT85019.1 hypothetical protein OZ660_13890 [Alteromonas sp. 009811495]
MKSLLSVFTAVTVSTAPVINAEPDVFMSFDFQNGELERGFDDWYYSDKGENPCQIYNGEAQSKLCRADGSKFYPYYNERNSDHMGWLQYGYIDSSSEFSVEGTSLRVHLTGGMYKDANGNSQSDGTPLRSKKEFVSDEDLGVQSLLPGDIALYYKGPTPTSKIEQFSGKNRLTVWVLMPRNSVDIDKYSAEFYNSPVKSFSFYPFVDTSKGAHYYHHASNIPMGGWTKIQFDASPTHKNSGGVNDLHAFAEGGTEYAGSGTDYFANIAAFNLRADFSKYLPANSVYYIDEVSTNYKPYENEETIKTLAVGYSPDSSEFDISFEDKYRCLDCSAKYEVRYSFEPIDNSNFEGAFTPAFVTNFDRRQSNAEGVIYKPNNGYNLLWASLKLRDEHRAYLSEGSTVYFAVRDISERAEGNYYEEDNMLVDVPGVGQVAKKNLVKTIDYTIVDVNYPLQIKTSEINQPVVGYNYEQEIVVEGGKSPYNLQAIGLPNGLTLEGNKLVGVASQASSDTVILSAIDNVGQTTDVELEIDVRTEDQLRIGQCKVLVEFGQTYLPSSYFDSVFHDIYTGVYQSGMTTLVGSNAEYNYQGISGSGIYLDAGDKIRLVWRNIGEDAISFAPRLSFSVQNRFNQAESHEWISLDIANATSGNTTVSELMVTAPLNSYSINVNSNFSNNKTLLLERIEVVSAQFDQSDYCEMPINFTKAIEAQASQTSVVLADFSLQNSSEFELHESLNSVFMDNYTGFYEQGLGIVIGNNGKYNYQGIKGDGINIEANAQLKVTWKNFSSEELVFAPMVSFDYEGRQIHGGTWFELSQTTVSGFDQIAQEPGTGYSQFELADLNITWLDLINISSNVSVNSSLVVEKIELIYGA